MLVCVRREYTLRLTLNGRTLRRVLIDPHYEIRHRASVDDVLILELLKLLDGEERGVESVTAKGFEIFRVDPVFYGDKAYRLVLTLPPKNREDSDYLGVINVFRIHERKRKQKE